MIQRKQVSCRRYVRGCIGPNITVHGLVSGNRKCKIEQASEAIYRIPCTSCDKVYVGETGRNFGVRMNEHRKEADQNEERDSQEAQSSQLKST